jgi:hypothetical protein
MWVFIWSGTLYLVGVTILLLWRPSLMFDDEGNWKEFRIGGDRDKYTWMPVWLALLLWALFCYIIVKLIMRKPGNRISNNSSSIIDDEYEGEGEAEPEPEPVVRVQRRRGKRIALPPGYYVLDKAAKNSTGTPHYVYIGELPDTEEA